MHIELMREMIADMNSVDDLYRPTNFWNFGLKSIIDDLEHHGFDTFREHRSAQRFYVPIYDFGPASRLYLHLSSIFTLTKPFGGHKYVRALDNMMTGRQSAFDDFRLFKAACTPNGSFNLDGISESEVGGGQRFTFDGIRAGRSFLNYLRGLAFLEKHVPAKEIFSALEIGGGYGTLGEILLKAREGSFYLNVDIPPVAAVSTWYLQQVFGANQIFTYRDAKEAETIETAAIRQRYRAAVICPWQLPRVTGSFDLFANFISFQEMEPLVVANYVRLIKPLISRCVLLRNSVHGKPVAKAGEMGVFEPTTTDRMISNFDDQFRLVGRDAYGAGQIKLSGPFTSEAILLVKK